VIARSFWPAGEAAQEDYEQLRNAVLAGVPIVGTTADRFRHGGLGDLIRQRDEREDAITEVQT